MQTWDGRREGGERNEERALSARGRILGDEGGMDRKTSGRDQPKSAEPALHPKCDRDTSGKREERRNRKHAQDDQ